jgi:serine/threonine protein kinase
MVDNGTSDKMIEHYRLIKPLGDGNYGVGWLANDTKRNEKVCVKLFKDMDEETEKTFRAEVAAGSQGFNHPNVLRLMAAGKSEIMKNGTPSGNSVFYIVSELAENGEAFDYAQMADGLETKYARSIFKQIVEAVGHVHSKGVAHRDLKLENLFLAKDCLVKLADFGLMKAFAGPMGSALMTECGTP